MNSTRTSSPSFLPARQAIGYVLALAGILWCLMSLSERSGSTVTVTTHMVGLFLIATMATLWPRRPGTRLTTRHVLTVMAVAVVIWLVYSVALPEDLGEVPGVVAVALGIVLLLAGTAALWRDSSRRDRWFLAMTVGVSALATVTAQVLA
ncbi:hypothetical protein [Nocardioides yefusunii]|uniref:Uncharacterized protein n=1 Tax=Nocardioides yefusunii TaxID=2500546 RepID=A0ABW1QYC3_9ACTN|nr:hypothetical protein [Nocardioides yefusunii]